MEENKEHAKLTDGPARAMASIPEALTANECIPNQVRISPRPNPAQYYPDLVRYSSNIDTMLSNRRATSGHLIFNASLISSEVLTSSSKTIRVPQIVLPKDFYRNIMESIKKRDWSNLLKYDQLYYDQSCNMAFSEWNEPLISFPPTYKYIPESDDLNLSQWERHCPSWTDRILYYTCLKPQKNALSIEMDPLIYNSAHHLTSSDHKPVFAYYLMKMESNAQNTATSDQTSQPQSHASSGHIAIMKLGHIASHILTIHPCLLIALTVILMLLIVLIFYLAIF